MTSKAFEQLESSACKYWPDDIAAKVVQESPIALLVATQDKFLSILKCADSDPEAWVAVLGKASLGANQFVKHLTVLTDVGGERLQRFGKDLARIFPRGGFDYVWQGKRFSYVFRDPTGTVWSNSNLLIDKDHLPVKLDMTDAMMDVCMLLLWGADILDDEVPVEIRDKCIVGRLIGHEDELEGFVRQRYIYVSRITGGSTANDGGHFCEESCVERLRKNLPQQFIIGGHSIKGVSQNKRNLVTFDIVITNEQTGKACAIEISFQVTTNSVIERKAAAARERQKILHRHGHKVAYIIDGAGNFQRKNAIRTIMDFSDCTVNFSDSGIKKLVKYIQESV